MAAKPGAVSLPRSVTFLAGLASFLLIAGVLYWAQAILIPVALAILVTFLLTPPVIRLQRSGVPKIIAVPLVVAASLLAVAAVGWIIAAQILDLTEELPDRQMEIVDNIDRLLDSLQSHEGEESAKRLGGLIQDIQETIKENTATEEKTFFGLGPIPVEIRSEESIPESIGAYLTPLIEPLATAGLVVVLVLFILFKREDLRNRIVTLSGRSNLAVTTKALDEAGQRIARYLMMQFIINMSYGVCVAVGLFALRVDYAALWGLAAAILRYVPYLGPWVAALLPLSYSILTSPSWGQPLGIVGMIVVLELVSNNVMEPLLYGRGVGLSEVAVILGAVFWGWLWGAVGLVLATPITACLVVAGRYVPALSIFNRILGDVPDVEPHYIYYQRLLARDEEEAEDLFDEQVAQTSFHEACENVIVPTLTSMKRDRMRGLISAEQESYILEWIEEHLEEVPLVAADVEPTDHDEPAIVFGYAVHDAEDEAALGMLAKLLLLDPCRFEVLSREMLLSEVLQELRERRPAGICLIGVPPGGTTHTRSLCKRLHAALPDLKIAVGRWGSSLPDKHRAVLREHGATYVGRTPSETREHVLSLARLKPAIEPNEAAEPVAVH